MSHTPFLTGRIIEITSQNKVGCLLAEVAQCVATQIGNLLSYQEYGRWQQQIFAIHTFVWATATDEYSPLDHPWLDTKIHPPSSGWRERTASHPAIEVISQYGCRPKSNNSGPWAANSSTNTRTKWPVNRYRWWQSLDNTHLLTVSEAISWLTSGNRSHHIALLKFVPWGFQIFAEHFSSIQLWEFNVKNFIPWFLLLSKSRNDKRLGALPQPHFLCRRLLYNLLLQLATLPISVCSI